MRFASFFFHFTINTFYFVRYQRPYFKFIGMIPIKEVCVTIYCKNLQIFSSAVSSYKFNLKGILCKTPSVTTQKNEAVRQGEEKMPSRFKLQNLQCSLIIHNDPRGEGGKVRNSLDMKVCLILPLGILFAKDVPMAKMHSHWQFLFHEGNFINATTIRECFFLLLRRQFPFL